MTMGNVRLTLCITIIALGNVIVNGRFQQAHQLSQNEDLNRGYRLSKSQNENAGLLSPSEYVPKLYTDLANTYLENFENLINWTQCEMDTYQVLKDLTKGSLYAIKFLDSFAKPPPGILDGHINWLGSYDECKTKVVVNGSDYFEGNYCKVTVSIPKLDMAMQGQMLSLGICVPSSCSENETETFIDFGMDLLRPVMTNISAHGVTCDKEVEWKTATYVAISVTVILITLALIGTLCDVIRTWRKSRADSKVPWKGGIDEPENGPLGDDVGLINDGRHQGEEDWTKSAPTPGWVEKVMDVFVCFSWISNGQKLLNSTVRTDYLGAINGIRFLSMSWVILGHTYVFALGAFSNTATGFEIVKRFSFQAIENATVSVDSFFFLSGLLVCYLTLNELRKNEGRVNWFLFYFHRFWRLTPAYMYVILVFVGLFPLLIKGPFTVIPNQEQGLANEGACEKYWWTNLLYINNFVPGDLVNECLGWGWYLANDMQFYVISPILIYLLYRFVYVGLSVITALIIFCLALTGGLATKYHMSASFIGELMHAEGGGGENGGEGEFMKIYIRPYHRIAPYLVGMLTGYALHRYKNTFKVHWMVNIFGWCCAAGINLSVIYGLYHYSNTLTPIAQGLSSFYIAANRFGWSLGLAWLSFACITGYGGPINAILSYSLWAPLGRLTYCAYLVHPIVMYVVYLNLRTPIYYTDTTAVYYFLGHLVLAYAVAFVVSLLIESPLMALEKLFLPKKDSAKTK